MKCTQCLEIFEAKQARQKFCSSKCRSAWNHTSHRESNLARMASYRQENAGRISAKKAQWYQENKESIAVRRRERVYGLTQVEYEQLLSFQGGTCAICDKFTELVVDHDHVTGEVRGILCATHNAAIGGLGDSPELLRRAADYLEGK